MHSFKGLLESLSVDNSSLSKTPLSGGPSLSVKETEGIGVLNEALLGLLVGELVVTVGVACIDFFSSSSDINISIGEVRDAHSDGTEVALGDVSEFEQNITSLSHV